MGLFTGCIFKLKEENAKCYATFIYKKEEDRDA